MLVPSYCHNPLKVSGLTLIEIMVTLALVASLGFAAMYPMQEWVNNNRIRSTADILHTGLQQAKVEAIRRSQTVVLALTDDSSFAAAGAAISTLKTANQSAGDQRVHARHWGLFTTQRVGSPADYIDAGIAIDSSAMQVTITGPKAICFNSTGRLVARTNAQIGVGDAICEATAIPAVYDIKMESFSKARNLRILVSVGGHIRMCDPNKINTLDACP